MIPNIRAFSHDAPCDGNLKNIHLSLGHRKIPIPAGSMLRNKNQRDGSVFASVLVA